MWNVQKKTLRKMMIRSNPSMTILLLLLLSIITWAQPVPSSPDVDAAEAVNPTEDHDEELCQILAFLPFTSSEYVPL
jgi:hypothetical protein